MKQTIRFLTGTICMLLLGTMVALGQILKATDAAANYGDQWLGNGGNGFEEWTFTSNPDNGFAGAFLETNASSASPNISTSNKSFGTFANQGNFPTVAVFRTFEAGFEIGDSFEISIQHGGISTGGSVGFTLRSGTANSSTSDYNIDSRFEFAFVGGNSNYQIFANGTTDTGIGFTSDGIKIKVILTDINMVDVTLTTLSDNNETTISDITLGGTVDASLLSLCLFNRDANEANAYFNNIELSSSGNLKITGNEGWRILSSPTSNNTYDDLLGTIWTQGMTGSDHPESPNPNVRTFDGTEFTAVSDLGSTMTAGTGFITYVYSDDDYTNSEADAGFPKTLSVSGTENSGSVSPTLTSGADSWTLVGNPYASTIDWDELTKNNLTGTVYVYDHSYGSVNSPDVADTGSVGGAYRVWNGGGGSLTNGLIAPFQGFWVQNASEGTPSLTIEEADKTTGGTFYKTSNESIAIKLRGEMENMFSESFLSFTEGGELAKDNFDGLKLSPLDFRPYLSVATLTGDTKLDINNLPRSFDNDLTIPVSVEAFTADSESGSWISRGGEVTLSWPQMKNLPDGWSITLNDSKTGATIDMRTAKEYVFDLAETSQAKAGPVMTILNPQPPQAERLAKSAEGVRFTVTVSANSSVSTEPAGNPEHFALEQNYPNPFNPTTVISYQVPVNSEVSLKVFDMVGREVATLVDTRKSAGQYKVDFDASGLSSGIYIYRLQAGSQVLTRQMTLIK